MKAPNQKINSLNYAGLKTAVRGSAAAIRIITRLEPAGHARDKVFPPTYSGGEYAFEERYPLVPSNGEDSSTEDKPVRAVLLHSVAGQANLMEEVLKSILGETPEGASKPFDVPLLKVDFSGTLAGPYVSEPVTVLDASHRVFDAIFRDSEIPAINDKSAVAFKETPVGHALATASLANATPLYEWSPTSLIFGCWNSADDKIPSKVKGTAKKLKYARAIVSEIVGFESVQGVRVGGKDDVVGITGQAIYRLPSSSETTSDKANAVHDDEGKVSYRKQGAALEWTQNGDEALKKMETVKKVSKEVPVYRAIGWEWTADPNQAAKNEKGEPVKWGKKGKPSELLLGQIVPTIGKNKDDNDRDRKTLPPDAQERLKHIGGGVTIKYALQTTVLSLSALRRLRFPVELKKDNLTDKPTDEAKKEKPDKENGHSQKDIDTAARTVLACLGLVAICAQRERDYFLRSRCELRAVESPPFEFVVQGREILDEDKFKLTLGEAVKLLHDALKEAREMGLTWKTADDMPNLKPRPNLAELIRLSHERGGAAEEDFPTDDPQS